MFCKSSAGLQGPAAILDALIVNRIFLSSLKFFCLHLLLPWSFSLRPAELLVLTLSGIQPLFCGLGLLSCSALSPHILVPPLTSFSSCRHLQLWPAASPAVTWCWRRSRVASRRPVTRSCTPTRSPARGPCRLQLASSSSSPFWTFTWRRLRDASTTGWWWTPAAPTLSSAARRLTGWRWTRRGTWWSCSLPLTSACRRKGSLLASSTVGLGRLWL